MVDDHGRDFEDHVHDDEVDDIPILLLPGSAWVNCGQLVRAIISTMVFLQLASKSRCPWFKSSSRAVPWRGAGDDWTSGHIGR